MKKACIVLPTYNEAQNIEEVLLQILNQTKKTLWNISILVVDDKSPDKTADIVVKFQKEHKNIFLLQGEKHGLGIAYTRGFDYAIKNIKPDAIFEMDADLSHPPKLIPLMLDEIDQGADFVIGSRYIPGGATPDWDIIRKIISAGGNFFARVVAGLHEVKDCTSGFRAIKTDIINKIDMQKLGAKGYSFQMNLLYEAIVLKANIKEVPLVFYDRKKGHSKMKFKDMSEFFINSFHLRLRSWERFIKFCIVGGTGVFINMGLLALFTELVGLRYQISSIFAIEASIIWNFFLNDVWTFRKSTNKSGLLTKLVKFNGVSLVGAAINFAVLLGLTEIMGIYYLISNLVGIIIATAWNYLANVKYTWRDEK